MFSGPWTDRSFCPSFLPSLSLASRLPGRQGPSPLLSSLLFSWVGLRSGPRGSGPGLTRKVQKARSLQTALATPRDYALPPSSREKSCSGTSHPPRLALALLESKRRRWRAPLSPWPRSPACPRALPSPASRAPFLPLPQVKQVKAGAVAGTGSGGVRVWGHGAGSPGRGKGGGRDRPRLTERTRERRGCRWWSPPP